MSQGYRKPLHYRLPLRYFILLLRVRLGQLTNSSEYAYNRLSSIHAPASSPKCCLIQSAASLEGHVRLFTQHFRPFSFVPLLHHIRKPDTPLLPRNVKTMDSSPFARLPPELRNHIYFLALVNSDQTQVKRRISKFWKAPSLLQTCSQIRTEALPIHYGNNTFTIIHWDALEAIEIWLRAIGPNARGFLRKVHMGYGDADLEDDQRLKRREDCKEVLRKHGLGIPGAVLLVGPTRDRVEARWRRIR